MTAVLIVILSVTVLMIATLHCMRTPEFAVVKSRTNLTEGQGLYKYYMAETERNHWLIALDTPCTIFLSVEYIARFTVSYGKWMFFINPLNVIDLLGVLPNWIQVFLEIVKIVSSEHHVVLQYVAVAMSFFSLFRMLRIFKIMMLNNQLRMLFLALAQSMRQLCILASLIVVLAAVFGSVGFYIELDNDTFATAFYAVWWAIVTMTTVGYGDFYPSSTAGYILGVVCSITGIIVIAVATTVIVNQVLTTQSAVEQYERSIRKKMKHADVADDLTKCRSGKNNKCSSKIQPLTAEQSTSDSI